MYSSPRMPGRQMGTAWQMERQTPAPLDRKNPEESPMNYGLAIVTSPVQCWQNLYTPCEALAAGTLFKELDLRLVGCRDTMNCNCRRNGGF